MGDTEIKFLCWIYASLSVYVAYHKESSGIYIIGNKQLCKTIQLVTWSDGENIRASEPARNPGKSEPWRKMKQLPSSDEGPFHWEQFPQS